MARVWSRAIDLASCSWNPCTSSQPHHLDLIFDLLEFPIASHKLCILDFCRRRTKPGALDDNAFVLVEGHPALKYITPYSA